MKMTKQLLQSHFLASCVGSRIIPKDPVPLGSVFHNIELSKGASPRILSKDHQLRNDLLKQRAKCREKIPAISHIDVAKFTPNLPCLTPVSCLSCDVTDHFTKDISIHNLTLLKGGAHRIEHSILSSKSQFISESFQNFSSLAQSTSHNDQLVGYSPVLQEPTEKDTQEGGPTNDQLEKIFSTLADTLPKVFTQSLDFTIYHPKVIVENNIRGNRTVGLHHLIKFVALVRAVAHFRFAYVNFEVLKITKHPEDGTVKVRWRIRGIGGIKVMINFWKYKLWKMKEVFDHQDLWYDGFSTFYVGNDGQVFRIVIDKVMPDSNTQKLEKGTVGPKLAILFGLLSPSDCHL